MASLLFRLVVGCMALVAVAAHSAAQESVSLKIMSFNIWYGGEQVSFAKVIEAIKAADPDIIGLQEPDGNTGKIAEAAGYPYVDTRRHIISRYPIFDSGSGEAPPSSGLVYSLNGVSPDTVHAWVLVRPGKAVAIANTHLSSDPYGPEAVRDGKTLEEVMKIETDTRLPEAEPLAQALGKLAKTGVPVFLTGDFNVPSHLDWTKAAAEKRKEIKFPVEWPVSKLLAEAGLADSYRAVRPDPVKDPGLTWTPGTPYPYVRAEETHDRIDMIWSANAKPVASVLAGESGNPDVAIAVDPWPSDHRAVVSTFEVTPSNAPALITVEPRPVQAGDDFRIRVNMPDKADWSAVVTVRGGNPATDALTGIANVGFWDRPSIKLTLPGRDEGGEFDAVLLDGGGKELARAQFTMRGKDAKAQLATEKASYKPGEPIQISFTDAPGYKYDWIALYGRGQGDADVYNYLGYVYTNARFNGTVTLDGNALSEPLVAGEYELRLMKDDHYAVQAKALFKVE